MESRLAHAEEIDELIADWMAERTREEIVDTFEAEEAALGPVYSMADIFEDDHFEARNAVLFIDDSDQQASDEQSDSEVAMRGVFPKLSETPGAVEHAGPALGAHAREVLRTEAGLTDEEIDTLLEEGVTAIDGQ